MAETSGPRDAASVTAGGRLGMRRFDLYNRAGGFLGTFPESALSDPALPWAVAVPRRWP